MFGKLKGMVTRKPKDGEASPKKGAPVTDMRTGNVQHKPGSQAHLDSLKKKNSSPKAASPKKPEPINRHKNKAAPSPTNSPKGAGKGGKGYAKGGKSPINKNAQSPKNSQAKGKGKGKGKGNSPKASTTPKATATTAHIPIEEPTGLTPQQMEMIKQKHGKKVNHCQTGARKHGYPDEVIDNSPQAKVDQHMKQAKADIDKHAKNAKAAVDAGKQAFDKAKGKGKGLPAAAKAAKEATDKKAKEIGQDKNLGTLHANSEREKLDAVARLDKSHQVAQIPCEDPKTKLAQKLDNLHNRFEMEEKAGFEQQDQIHDQKSKIEKPPASYDVNQNMKKIHFKGPRMGTRGVNSNKNGMSIQRAEQKGREIYAN